MEKIIVRGARTHNLKDINLELPRDSFIVITGLSGSGKSSIAFDTLYAEGQRRYVESLSTYARQFLSLMEKPDVDHIEGLSPAISIEQKSTSHNPRSTVGTITEIYDYLRLLFARAGTPRCPEHETNLEIQTISQMVDTVLALPEQTKIMLLAPIIKGRKGEHLKLFEKLKQEGFIRLRVDGQIFDIDEIPHLNKNSKHDIDVVVDRFKVRKDIKQRIADSFETALKLAEGVASISYIDGENEDSIFSANYSCPKCGYSLDELEPRLFSFNNPAGACEECDGLGVKQYFDAARVVQYPNSSLNEGAIRGWDKRNIYYFHMLNSLADHFGFSMDEPFEKLSKKHQNIILNGSVENINFTYVNDRGDTFERNHPFEGIIPNLERRYLETQSQSVRDEMTKFISSQPCSTCQGSRLNLNARNVFIKKNNLSDITELPTSEALEYFSKLNLPGKKGKIAKKIIKEIHQRLEFLVDVGLNYLTLDRNADSLSGGEAQRIRLASQIGAGLVGVMYILDEPSIGLHQRDNERLLKTLTKLRDLGNTVIVVEHDEDAIRSADYIVDIGPGAGIHGGEIVAQGSLEKILENKKSITGRFLSGNETIDTPETRVQKQKNLELKLLGAQGNNLKNVNVSIPLGLLTCVTGVSGSGKSTLINGTLYPAAALALNGAINLKPSPYTKIEGFDLLDKCIDINQSPIGRTPRSNPATYTGIFTPVRELFAGTQEARARGYKIGRFSFNVKGGRCEACQGDGVIKVEMHFLPDIYVACDVCGGKRYNRETLEITYKGKNIYEVLDMTAEHALEFFSSIPSIKKKLQTLVDVGLTYVKLGQAASTLSGGEAQRVKLAKELSKRDTGRTLYILDEPTTGLHFADIKQLLSVIDRLKTRGNTIVIIEHNLDVIKTADWIIDLGPEGGSGGGEIIAEGPPEKIVESKRSHTGVFLKKLLKK